MIKIVLIMISTSILITSTIVIMLLLSQENVECLQNDNEDRDKK